LAVAWDGAPLELSGDTSSAPNAATYDVECQSQFLLDHQDMLYALSAPRAGRIAAELSADFEAVVYALRGDCSAPQRVQCGPAGPAVLIDVAAGDPLILVVDGRATDEEGPFSLRLSYADPPANDLCAQAQPVSAVADADVVVTGTLVGAAGNLSEPFECHGFSAADDAGADVFFDVLSPVAGSLEITIDANFDVVLAAPGACGVSATPADRCDVYSPRLVLPSAAGEHHLIAVDGNDELDLGSFALTVRARGRPPTATAGETCAAATPLAAPAQGASLRYELDLPSLNNDLSCASACSSFSCGGRDGVFTVTTAAAGTLRIEAEGMDTVLSAYPGASCAGTPTVCADTGAFGDVLREQVFVPSTAGGTVTLVVDSFADFSTAGIVTLTLEQQP
ncbi:MAG: hypothetical protein IT382_19520, partial [Deltaproteobacteria bacterium]|nr:hypothetical protein [Deltaproteobacteria bacterium]